MWMREFIQQGVGIFRLILYLMYLKAAGRFPPHFFRTFNNNNTVPAVILEKLHNKVGHLCVDGSGSGKSWELFFVVELTRRTAVADHRTVPLPSQQPSCHA